MMGLIVYGVQNARVYTSTALGKNANDENND